MEGNKETIYNYMKDDKIYICVEKESKQGITRQQQKTFYKLFTDIGNHLGETKEDIHYMMLGGIFGTKKVKIGRITREVNIEKHTSKLTKEQGIKFIDTIISFAKRENMPITVTNAEIKSLYESYY